ncbi:hypothetical protein CH274_13440 [Rhodococcus sp. 06-418-5]|nr:hypothetical protein CH274_13440 [Rhodococcus sp. 06-418-5]
MAGDDVIDAHTHPDPLAFRLIEQAAVDVGDVLGWFRAARGADHALRELARWRNGLSHAATA